MRTIKELADIGTAASKKVLHRAGIDFVREALVEETAHQAFAQAVRDAVLAELVTKPDSSSTFEAHGFTWFKHKPGDPMPCDGEAEIVYIMRDRGTYSDTARALRWTAATKDESRNADIIGWHYADKPTTKTVPLDINDIRATDEFRPCGEVYQLCTLRHANENGLSLLMHNGMIPLTYEKLATHYLRRQHGSDEWKPCTKEIPTP